MGILDVVLVPKMLGVQWGGPEYCGAQGRSLTQHLGLARLLRGEDV